jgi:hypothetical protein
MAKLSMRVGRKSLGILNHVFDSSIWSICSSMINIYGFKLNVERRVVSSVKPYDILPNLFNLGFRFIAINESTLGLLAGRTIIFKL